MADKDTAKNADFIGRVVSDAKSPPETRLLTGWLGDAADKKYRRLYTEADLSAYFDIPAEAILYTEPIRDVQPSGGVFVWFKRDAELKPGGSAASRAGRFLLGQVQQDFESGASPEQAGFRCATQVPCGEPTGFSGQCTEQPVVGGAWPCITAIPHCSEPTGFTGKCTFQPWPNPTRYIGCTFLHCPTQDLTHIPHICNIVATGVPGCPVVDPLGGGDPAANAGVAAKAKAGKEGAGSAAQGAVAPPTTIPGCGYTRTWGLCKPQPFTPATVCTQVDCGGAFGAAAPGTIVVNTRLPQCNLSAVDACPTRICQTQPPPCNLTPVDGCPTRICHTPPPQCNVTPFIACPPTRPCLTEPPTAQCTHIGPMCHTQETVCHTHETVCTQSGPQCPTSCGPDCQSQQVNCTQVGELCLTRPVECTRFGPKCPTFTDIRCTVAATQVGPNCQLGTHAPPCVPALGAQAFRAAGAIGPTAFLGCTQSGPQCPTQPQGDCTFFGCTQLGARCPTHFECTMLCTHTGPGCLTQPQGDCTFFSCTQLGPRCPTHQFECTMFCTHAGPRCPTHGQPHCTFSGPGCPPTPATICTQLGPHCPTPGFECTMFCTQAGPCLTQLQQRCQ